MRDLFGQCPIVDLGVSLDPAVMMPLIFVTGTLMARAYLRGESPCS
jgi:hypothetical protein